MEFIKGLVAQYLAPYFPYVETGAEFLGYVVVIATAIAWFTPTKKDDEIVGQLKVYWLKMIAFLPTIGVNPETKKLKEKLEALEAKKPQ